MPPSRKPSPSSHYVDTFEEWGEMPQEDQGKSKDVDRIYDLLKGGASNLEIIEAVPSWMLNIDKLEHPRSVMNTYGYHSCYRVTEYKHPFDTYDGQDVIIFEEFRGGLRHGDMLNYLDGYPLLLPCRYFNRQACYTKVYLITNIPPDDQFLNVDPESRDAFSAESIRWSTTRTTA